MATGDQQDIFQRLRQVMPPWFAGRSDDDENPILNALLWGAAYALSLVYSLVAYAKLQTRVATATDGWLDMISADFFGTSLPRKQGQNDTSYRAAIIARLFREAGTRKAIRDVLLQITGIEPRIIEPYRAQDCGAWGELGGWGVTGAYGSVLLPYQAFVTAYRPPLQGVPYVAGYNIPAGGYGVGEIEWADSSSLHALTDADIFAAVDAVKPYGTRVWMNISSGSKVVHPGINPV